MKISVVVPIYNAEKYLRQCIESVTNQSYRELELILVNDGSTDTSIKICNEYACRDDRIIVVNKKNGGAADARNEGILVSTGEYILFLDSDDYWNDKYAIERLVVRVKSRKTDILNFSYVKLDEKAGIKKPYLKNIESMPNECNTKEKQLEYIFLNNAYIASSCNKLIRTSLIKDNECYFRLDTLSEDIEWSLLLLKEANSLDFICENFYIYRQHDESNTHVITNKKCRDLKNDIIRCLHISQHIEGKYKKYFFQYTAFQYGTFFMAQAKAEYVPIIELRELEKYSKVLRFYGHNKKIFLLYASCNILGVYNLARLIRSVSKNK